MDFSSAPRQCVRVTSRKTAENQSVACVTSLMTSPKNAKLGLIFLLLVTHPALCLIYVHTDGY